ncbi:non-ribosomal peptide synthetase [Tistrella bauzanensis]|nr:non-ribosomal peptide synthetase [Tistrella bauzanensis]
MSFRTLIAHQNIWLDERLNTGRGSYHIGGHVEIAGHIDHDAFKSALNGLLDRHSSLQLCASHIFTRKLPQFYISTDVSWSLGWRDFSGTSNPDLAAHEHMQAWFREPFPDDAPLFRWALIRLAPDRHLWFKAYHHLLVDGAAISLIVQDAARAYTAIIEGREPQSTGSDAGALPDPLTGDEAAAERYWTDALDPAPAALVVPPPLPDLAAPAPGRRLTITLARDRFNALDGIARTAGIGPAPLITTVFAAALLRVTGAGALVAGLPVANRPSPAHKAAIGLFATLQPAILSIAGADRPLATATAFSRQLRAGYRHRRLPLAAQAAVLARSRGRHAPAFDLTLSFERHDYDARFGTAASRAITLSTGREPHPLAVFVRDYHDDAPVVIDIDWRSDAHSAADIAECARRFQLLVARLIATPDATLDQIDRPDAADGSTMPAAIAGALPDNAAGPPLADAVLAAAGRTPDATAVVEVETGRSLSYRDLAGRARRRATALATAGIGPEALVGLAHPRGIELVVSMLAVVLAGGAWMPLDPDQPPARQAAVLASAKPVLILDDTTAGALDSTVGADAGAGLVQHLLHPQQLAYLLHTSGSTGRPKPVAIPHQALAAHMAWMQRAFPLGPGDVVLHKTPSGFDASIWEVWAPLMAGARLVLAPTGSHRDPDALGRALTSHAVTTLQVTPTLLDALIRSGGLDGGHHLTRLFVGGEALAMTTIAAARTVLPDACAIINLYGPTECCIDAASWTAGPPLPAPLPSIPTVAPLGQPVDGASLAVLDDTGQPVAIGVVGELAIGGTGVGRGYPGDPARTANTFRPDPDAARPGARRYLTGDRVRLDAAGRLLPLGRLDDQIKLHGQRIEPAEIEAALTSHPAILRAGVALARLADGSVRLGAHLVPAPGEVLPDMAGLRRHLQAILPVNMHPTHISTAADLPLTASGKLDRRALAADAIMMPAAEGEAGAGIVDPIMQGIATIWAEVLASAHPASHDVRPGPQDDFFALGGHSLKAMQVATRLRAVFEVEIGMEDLFDHPRLVQLAARVTALRRHGTALPPPPLIRAMLPDGTPRPLSFAQERIWFLAQWPDGAVAYNMAMAVRIDGPLRLDALNHAVAGVIARHPMLRSRIATIDGDPVQIVEAAASLPIAVPVEDLSALPDTAQAQVIADRSARDAASPFDLATAPLIRLALLRLGADAHILLINLHHIAGDGWSGQIILEDLAALYDGGTLPPPPSLTYADVAAWQRLRLTDAEIDRQLGFWHDVLTAVPVLDLPTDRPRPPVVSSDGDSLVHLVAPATADQLRRLAVHASCTPFMVILALFAALLGRMAGQSDIVIGTPVTNRPDPDIEPLVGFFTNTLPIRLRLDGDPAMVELLTRARRASLAAFDHPDVPFERLVDAFAPERRLSHTPLFQVMLAWQMAGASRLDLAGVQLTRMAPVFTAAKFDLMLSVEDLGGSMIWRFDYRTQLFDAATIALIADQLDALARHAAGTPDARLSALVAGLADGDGAPARPAWVTTPDPAAEPAGIAAAVLDAAGRDPDAAAVVDATSGETLRYAGLVARAGRRAAALVRAGAGPEAVIALAHPRGIELVVSMLAVVMTGAAWLALDPDEPEARLRQIRDQAAPALILDDDSVRALDAGAGGEMMPAPRPIHPDQLAYILFTSGSTGTPKGVMVPHRALARHMDWMSRHFPLTAGDAVLQKTPVGFDASVWEFWAPLMAGARLVLAPAGSHRDPAMLGDLLQAQAVTVLQATPTLIDALADAATGPAPLARARHLRRLFSGGEALGAETIAAARATLPAGCAIINLYGPTECCIDATAWVADAVPASGTAPLGSAIDGSHLAVIDATGHSLPPGLPGELAIGGDAVGRGYLSDPARTALAFRPDPAATSPGARRYLTGDRVRVDAAGRLCYQGRIDAQVKLRGQRIEPAEIEAALIRHPGIAQAGVVVRAEADGTEALIAWLLLRGTAPLPAPEALRRHLARHLPIHMIPARFIHTTDLPLTTSGKLDRRALAARAVPAGTATTQRLPATPTEHLIAGIWSDILGRPAIGIDDDFFALGGHSLKAVRMVGRLNEALPVDVPLRTVFENPTIATLAPALEALADALAADLAGTDDDLAALLASIESLPDTAAQ